MRKIPFPNVWSPVSHGRWDHDDKGGSVMLRNVGSPVPGGWPTAPPSSPAEFVCLSNPVFPSADWGSGGPFQLLVLSASTGSRVGCSLSNLCSCILWNKYTHMLWKFTATHVFNVGEFYQCSRNLKKLPTSAADGLPFSACPHAAFPPTSDSPSCLLPPRWWPAFPSHWENRHAIRRSSLSFPLLPGASFHFSPLLVFWEHGACLVVPPSWKFLPHQLLQAPLPLCVAVALTAPS